MQIVCEISKYFSVFLHFAYDFCSVEINDYFVFFSFPFFNPQRFPNGSCVAQICLRRAIYLPKKFQMQKILQMTKNWWFQQMSIDLNCFYSQTIFSRIWREKHK